MYENQIWLRIIPIVSIIMYLIILFLIRFIFKIKRDYELESEARKTFPKLLKYIYCILLVVAILGYIVFNIEFKISLLLMLAGELVISIKVLSMTTDIKQKYHQYFTITFNSIFILFITLFYILNIIQY